MKSVRSFAGRFCTRVFITSALMVLLPALASGQVVIINEFMANEADYSMTVGNTTYTGDWIELYNTSGATVGLGNWSMSSGTNYPQYVFPFGTTIGPYGYLLLFCDGQATNAFHTSFKLSSSGETIYLFTPYYTTNDMVSYGRQLADLSSGRVGGSTNWGLCVPTPAMVNQAYALTGTVFALRFNEWAATNYKADLSPDDDWLEIYNMTNKPVQIGGVVMADTNNPAPTKYPGLVQAYYLEPYGVIDFKCDKKKTSPDHLNFGLSSTSGQLGLESLFMFDANRTNLIDQVGFPGNTQSPGYWTGDTSYGRLPDGSPNIVLFPAGRTTRGELNFLSITNVVINEVLSHTDPPFEDAIELWNPTTNQVDISYWWISNDPNTPKKFRIPPNTRIPAGGFKVFYEMVGVTNQLVPGYYQGFNTSGEQNARDFTLNSAKGDMVYLFSASSDASGTLTGYRRGLDFGPAANGVSFGRYVTSTGEPDIVAMSRQTFGTSVKPTDPPSMLSTFRTGQGATNSYPLIGPLVITKIMYHPPDIGTNDNSLDEYIEVYNVTTNTVFLYDTNGLYYDGSYHTNGGYYADGRTNTWRFRGVVDFDFPTNQSLGPGRSLLMVNFDPVTNAVQLAAFKAKYNVPATVPLYGAYKGKLANNHGSVELYKPDPPQGPNHWEDFTNGVIPRILVDKVKYDDIDPWPVAPDGTGAALERIKPEEYGNDPVNWRSATPTPGWQPVKIAPARQGSSLTLSFTGMAGSSYSVQYRTSLGSGSWTKLTNIAAQATTGPRQATDSIPSANAARFYRIVTPAQP